MPIFRVSRIKPNERMMAYLDHVFEHLSLTILKSDPENKILKF